MVFQACIQSSVSSVYYLSWLSSRLHMTSEYRIFWKSPKIVFYLLKMTITLVDFNHKPKPFNLKHPPTPPYEILSLRDLIYLGYIYICNTGRQGVLCVQRGKRLRFRALGFKSKAGYTSLGLYPRPPTIAESSERQDCWQFVFPFFVKLCVLCCDI